MSAPPPIPVPADVPDAPGAPPDPAHAPPDAAPAPEPEQGLGRTWRRHHRDMLIICALAVVLAFVLEVRPDREHVGLRGTDNCNLPGSCLSREWFHFDCPGCGLTRSIVLLAGGHFAESWHMHRVGWVMALLIVAQLPYRALCLKRDRWLLGQRVPWVISCVMIALLFGNWFAGMLFGW